MSAYRVKFVIDEEAEFEECNGESRPLTEAEYEQNYYQKNGQKVSYADYLAYYGNPDRHIYLGIVVQKQCECCESWKTVDSLWNVDMMDDNVIPPLDSYMPPEQAITFEYLGDEARGMLEEAGWTNEPK